ncbi:MAG: DUF3082 domain-containing protein [Cyanobacteria bacterium REEB459]|nr:DUF3082 domain-containing protein [Cyanobacteria bacterium REEB459]
MVDPSSPVPTAPQTPWRRILNCFAGALIAATIALLAYQLTTAIATTFAHKPILSANPTVVNLTAAVRTLVMGITALATGVFGIAALGLFLLGIQWLIQRLTGKAEPESS